LLALDATRARDELGWRERLTFPRAVEWTVQWQRRVLAGEDPRAVTTDQLAAYAALMP